MNKYLKVFTAMALALLLAGCQMTMSGASGNIGDNEINIDDIEVEFTVEQEF